ncbi:MAG TPA: glycosyltransferase [Smithellaceae bacterium]|nr:glycosyltransferase [Smithellaceae bacterium]
MANFLINGLKSKTGGGKSILNNYLGLLKNSHSTNKFLILTPNVEDYKKYACDFVKILNVKSIYKKNIFFPFTNHFLMPKLLKDLNIDVIFNLGDIVIPTNIPQVYLFDWSYAVYPDSIVWNHMDAWSYCERKIKLHFFKKYINRANVVIAQTKTIKIKLEALYSLRNVVVIPNAVSLENMNGGEDYNFELPKDKFKCLYLTYYYSNKNIEIFVPLAKKIQKEDLPFCLVVTIAPTQHKRSKQFLDTVKKEHLTDTIINVGPVAMSRVPSLYAQTDALLMPSLLESFSGTYVEAMFHGKPILTSDMDFAVDVCGDSAFYFNPSDANSILDTISKTFEDVETRKRKILAGRHRLKQFMTWSEAFDKYQEILDSCR